MTKIAINICFGGFSLSDKAYERLIELGIPRVNYSDNEDSNRQVIYDDTLADDEDKIGFGRFWDNWISDDNSRTHPLLIQVIEELGKESWGSSAELRIIKIPSDVEWHIHEYDGTEHVAENHRTWR